MKSIHLTVAVVFASTLATCLLAQASEITEFPVNASTSVASRTAIKAEARRLNDVGALRYDAIGPREVAPGKSLTSREQVRNEAAASARTGGRSLASTYYVGGM